MPDILIKKMPDDIHRRLKDQAERHHRSMNKEVLAILEDNLQRAAASELPKPVKPLRPIDGKTIVSIIRRMRERNR